MRAIQNNPTNSISNSSSKSRLGKHLIAGTIGLGLLFVAANSQAQSNFYWNGSAAAPWASASQWNLQVISGGVTSYVNGVDWPGDPSDANDPTYQSDIAWFTNSGTINVSLASPAPASFILASNVLDNASNTTLNATLSIGPGVTYVPGGQDAIVLAQTEGATSIFSIVTSGGTLNPSFLGPTVRVGKNGFGEFFVTNQVTYNYGDATFTLGGGSNSQGLLVIANPGTVINMGTTSGGHLNVGAGFSYGSTVILSNSARLNCPNIRIGCDSESGSSNNVMIVDSGALLFIAGGHAVVGNRAGDTAGTNAPALNNTLIFQNGGYGDSSNHTFSVGWADNDVNTTPPCTGNVVIIQSGCALTNISQCAINSNNSAFVYGGAFGGGYGTNAAHQPFFDPFGGTVSNFGTLACWGTLQGSTIDASGGVMVVSNNVGPLAVLHELYVSTGSVLQVSLGSSFNTITAGSNVTLHGTMNFVDSGGFNTVGNHTYTLFTGNFATNLISGTTTSTVPYYADTNNLTIGTVPNPSATYTISLPDFHTINLIIGGLTPALPFQVTSITRTNSGVDGNNDILVQWNTAGTNNHVLAGYGSANGSYSSGNAFSSLASIVVTTPTTNYLDIGGATNRPTRYYRISSP